MRKFGRFKGKFDNENECSIRSIQGIKLSVLLYIIVILKGHNIGRYFIFKKKVKNLLCG